jgi:hypothetical protein
MPKTWIGEARGFPPKTSKREKMPLEVGEVIQNARSTKDSPGEST